MRPRSSTMAMPTAACENIARSCRALAPRPVPPWRPVTSSRMRVLRRRPAGGFACRSGIGPVWPAVELCTGAEHHRRDSAAKVPMPHEKLLLSLLALLLPGLASAASLAQLVRDDDRQGAIEALRAGADVNELLPDGSTALMWAVHRVDHELVRELLARGADPDARNVLGATALSEAASVADVKLVEMLLGAGADPNLGNDDNQTPLMIAARVGSRPIAEKLLKAGARVNEREKYREQTALMWA